MCPLSDSVASVRKGDRVQVKVARIIPAGVIVTWGGGASGIVRNRELDWERALDHSATVLNVNDEFPAIVLEVETGGRRIELSRKRAIHDPWQKVRDGQYGKDMIVRGEVVNVVHFGAFVEIEPGIEGLLRDTEIPRRDDQSIGDLLWIGDQVEVCIKRIDLDNQEITLSLLERLRRRAEASRQRVSAANLDTVSVPPSKFHLEYSKLYFEFGDLLGQRIHFVTVIDNEVEFADEFADWLRRWGYQVSVITDGQLVQGEVPVSDLVFIDIDLGHTDGLKIARHIRQSRPEILIVLMSGLNWFVQNHTGLQATIADGLLVKPFQNREVLELLAKLERGQRLESETEDKQVSQTSQVVFLQRVVERLRSGAELHRTVEDAIAELRERMDATAAVLFAVDQFSLKTSIYASSNFSAEKATKSALDALRFSVVRNVAVAREEVLTGGASLDGRFASLLLLLEFESCIGVSLPNVTPDALYALFVFDQRGDHFNVQHTMLAASMACLLASRIQTEAAISLLQKVQQLILAGQVTSSLLHELRNKLSVVGQASSNLLDDYEDFTSEGRRTPSLSLIGRMRRRTERISDASQQLGDLLNEYLGLTRQGVVEEVNVNEVLANTIRQIRSMARDSAVDTSTELDPHTLRCMAVTGQLAQVFLNVALNALQQMGIQRAIYDALPAHTQGAWRGHLKVASHLDLSDKERPLKIRFTDEGSGIHRKQWDWIFELGTTTRNGGTGLGLYLCRSLLATLGGRITVGKSYMFVGTTFLIELPAAPGKGGLS
jgi:signal transduction histidine kinase/predicted RNA-binding protein with RPS1 domain